MSDLGNKEVMSKNIQKYMKRQGITRNKMVDDLGFKYTTLRDWIKGKTYPRIDKIEAMANYFNVNKSDLIEDEDKQPENNDEQKDIEQMIKNDDYMTFGGRPLTDEEKKLLTKLLRDD